MKAELVPENGDPPIPITRDLVVVGRRSYCDIVIDHPSLSKRHCVLVKTDGLLVIRDLISTNGTKVKGQKIRWAALLPDDRISVGSTSSAFTTVPMMCRGRPNFTRRRAAVRHRLGSRPGAEAASVPRRSRPSAVWHASASDRGPARECAAFPSPHPWRSSWAPRSTRFSEHDLVGLARRREG